MATDTSSQMTPATRIDQFIEKELVETSGRLRVAEMVRALLITVAWFIAVLLVLVLVDSWITPLSGTVRLFGLIILLGGAAVLFCHGALPFLIRRINPHYVARMIEHSGQSFHNSLLNYLLLRGNRENTRRPIYDAVSRRAATDLSALEESRRVDFSGPIRMGFVVAAMLAMLVAYIVFSPKNPWTSLARILAPGSRLAPASIVTVSNVRPGDSTLFFGDRLKVTCEVRGLRSADQVRLLYSSRDGQIDTASVVMQPTTDGTGVWSGVIACDPGGISTDLDYFVTAGDGTSPSYHISVRPNPTITVQTLVIEPPKYTRLPTSTQSGRGEIHSPEGSRVTITATANQDIQLAWIELVRSETAGTVEATSSQIQVVQSIDMRIGDSVREAVGEFQLLLDRNRQKQTYTHYRIRFRTRNDERNAMAGLHPVQIISDAAPEVSILRPEQTMVELPENGSLPIEIHAADLDYEISDVQLIIDHRGSLLLDQKLQLPLNQINQQVISQYLLQPQKLRLKAGDEIVFYAKALDNRTSPFSDVADPNHSRTQNYTARIVAADPNAPTTPEQQPSQSPQAGTQETNPDSQNDESQDNPDQNNDPQDRNSQDPSGDETQSRENAGSSPSGNQPKNQTENSPGSNPDSAQPKQPAERQDDKGQTPDSENKSEDNPGEKNPGEDSQSEQNQSDEKQSGNSNTEEGGAEGGEQSQAADGQQQSSSEGSGQKSADNSSGGSQDGSSGGSSGNKAAGESDSGQQSESATDSQGSNSSNASSQGSDSSTPKNSDPPAQPPGENPGGTNSSGADQNTSENPQSDQNQNRGSGEPGKSDDESADGGEGTGTDSTGQSNSEASSSDAKDGANNSTGGSDDPANRDSSLMDGNREPLSKNATAGERMEAIQQYLKEEGEKSKNEQNSSSPQPQPGDPNSNANGNTQPGNSTETPDRNYEKGPDNSASSPSGSQTGNEQDQSEQNAPGENDSGEKDPSGQNSGDANQKDPDASQNSNKAPGQSAKPDDQTGSEKSTGENSSSGKDRPDENKQSTDTEPAGDSTSEDSGRKSESETEGSEKSIESDKAGTEQGGMNRPESSQDDDPGSAQGTEGSQSGNEPKGKSPNGAQSESDSNPVAGSDQNKSGSDSASNQGSNKANDPVGGQKGSEDKGQSGNQAGDQPGGNQGGQSGSQPGDQSPAGEGGQSQQSSDGNPESGDTKQPGGKASGSGGAKGGGGAPGESGNSDANGPPPNVPVDPAIKKQIEYSRAVTDLVLSSLEEKQSKPDPKLLDRVNLTEQELRDFLAHWKTMRDAAKSGDIEAQEKYAEALQSLGLGPGTAKAESVNVLRDAVTGMTEDGSVNRPAAEDALPFNAFMKARSRVENQQNNR